MNTNVDLPNREMNEALEVLCWCVETDLKEEEMSLVGGTALEVRWKHRRSTDIDLFMPQDLMVSKAAAAQLRGGRPGWSEETRKRFAARTSQTEEEKTPSYEMIRRGTVRGIPFSIYGNKYLDGSDAKRETVGRTKVRLGTAKEALAGKILSRWKEEEILRGEETIPIRDLFDVIMASIKAPAELEEVRKILRVGGAREVAQTIRDTPKEAWIEDEQPVLSRDGTQDRRVRERVVEMADAVATGIALGDWRKAQTQAELLTPRAAWTQRQQGGWDL